MKKRIIITGAGSAIAQAVARQFVTSETQFFLIDRNRELLESIAADLRVRGAARVETTVADLQEFAHHPTLLEQAERAIGATDLFFVAHGTLPQQQEVERSWPKTQEALAINQLSAMSLLTEMAQRMETRQSGTIAVIGSVAGDRGRRSNYIYGTAKGALAIFLQGLRHRLTPAGVQVLTIKPGFVDTPMTVDFKKGLLWVKPDVVAKDIVRAIKRNKKVIYTPRRWWWIMFIIRLIPESLFVKTKL